MPGSDLLSSAFEGSITSSDVLSIILRRESRYVSHFTLHTIDECLTVEVGSVRDLMLETLLLKSPLQKVGSAAPLEEVIEISNVVAVVV